MNEEVEEAPQEFRCTHADCVAVFLNQLQLVQHYIDVHQRYRCAFPVCPCSFADAQGMATHNREEHLNWRQKCKTCNVLYKKNAFKYHVRAKKDGTPGCPSVGWDPEQVAPIGERLLVFSL